MAQDHEDVRARCATVSALRQRLSVAASADERDRIRAELRSVVQARRDLATAFAQIVLATLLRLEGDPSAGATTLDKANVADASGPDDLRDVVRAQEAIERVQTCIVLGHEERATEVARGLLVLARRLGGQWPLSACTAYAEAMSARGRQEQVEAFLTEVLAGERGTPGSALLSLHLEARLAIAQSSTWCDAPRKRERDLAELAARLGKLAAEPALAGLRASLVRRRIHVELERGDTARARELATLELAGVGASAREVLRYTGFRARSVLLGVVDPGGASKELAEERDALRAALQAFLTQVEREPVSENGVGWFRYAEFRDAVAVLLGLEAVLEPGVRGAERCAGHLFAIHAVGSLSRSLGGPEVGLATFRERQLAGDEVALVPWFAPHASWVVAVTREGTQLVALPSDRAMRPHLEAALAALHGARGSVASAKAEASFDHAATELAAWCLDATLQALIASHDLVTIVGIDPVTGPPFDALPIFGTRLGLAKRVRWLPSARMAAGLLERDPGSRPGGRRILVASSGRSEPEDAVLGLSAAEVHALASPSHGVAALLGTRATLRAFTAAPLDEAASLTILAHGANSRGGTARTAIALTPAQDDGLLSYERVRALRVPPLVVLAVCASVAEASRIGDDGVHHLGGAFFRSGASTLLSSPAELPLDATVALVAAFERGVRAGLLPSVALRGARCEVVRSRGRSDPHEYATLLLTGLDRNPLVPRPSGPTTRPSPRAR